MTNTVISYTYICVCACVCIWFTCGYVCYIEAIKLVGYKMFIITTCNGRDKSYEKR